MSRWISLVLSCAFAVLGWGVAAYAAFVAGMACDEGCDPQSPSWTDHRDAVEWSYFSWLGLAFAVLATLTTVAIVGRRHRRVLALTALGGCALVATLLWWRFDEWSSSAADDFVPWSLGVLVVGLTATLTSDAAR